GEPFQGGGRGDQVERPAAGEGGGQVVGALDDGEVEDVDAHRVEHLAGREQPVGGGLELVTAAGGVAVGEAFRGLPHRQREGGGVELVLVLHGVEECLDDQVAVADGEEPADLLGGGVEQGAEATGPPFSPLSTRFGGPAFFSLPPCGGGW